MDHTWNFGEIGAGQVEQNGDEFRLIVPSASNERYHDAQLTDYDPQQARFQNQPPLKLTLTARAQGDIQGTAGFGFWNHMYVPGERGFRIPQAIWFFFGSPPNNMALAHGVPGYGWKASTFNARRWQFFALLPLAPLGFLLMRNRWFYDHGWHIGQRAIGVTETLLDPALLHDFHTYTLDWQPDGATFSVDDKIVHTTDLVPTKPLGFIAWVDNQYAIVTPQGRFGWGLLEVPWEQSLILRDINITRM